MLADSYIDGVMLRLRSAAGAMVQGTSLDPEELVSATVDRLYSKQDRLSGDVDSDWPFVVGVAGHVLHELLRDSRRRHAELGARPPESSPEPHFPAASGSSPSEAVRRRETGDRLVDFLRNLPDRERHLLHCISQGRSPKEIAHEEGIQLDALNMRIHRLRRFLIERLGDGDLGAAIDSMFDR